FRHIFVYRFGCVQIVNSNAVCRLSIIYFARFCATRLSDLYSAVSNSFSLFK
ncbi:unnamed protein product, partial [Cylicocyclus nassatus]